MSSKAKLLKKIVVVVLMVFHLLFNTGGTMIVVAQELLDDSFGREATESALIISPIPTSTPNSPATVPSDVATKDLEAQIASAEAKIASATATLTTVAKNIKKKLKMRKTLIQASENIELDVLGIVNIASVTATLSSDEGSVTKVPATLNEENDTIEIKNPRSFKPGKYNLTVEENEDVLINQNFAWGVLAINTNKSYYQPNEQGFLQMTVLDEEGKTVCDADLSLTITNLITGTSSKLTSKAGEITKNAECINYDAHITPDYQSYYTFASEGLHTLALTAKTKNGTFTVEDSIEVKNTLPFDIERDSATRVFPPETYPMKVTITANEDFKGTVVDFVPQQFQIKQIEGLTPYDIIETNQSAKEIYWNLNLKKGERIKIGYLYQAPEISPEFYLIGPLQLYTHHKTPQFEESRYWQIAGDDTSGPRFATASGDCVNTTGIGTVAWTSAGNAFSDNTTYASASVDGTTTNYIKCTNFGFTIPTSSTIDGIVVTVERKSNSTGNGGSADAAMRIVKGGTIGTTDKKTTTTYTTSDVAEDHGNSTEKWGETWTVSDINASNFGAAFAATKASSAGAAHSVTVDYISITVHYTPPIVVSGNVYNAGTSSPLTACDASGATFELAARVGSTTYTASCSNSDGSFSFSVPAGQSSGAGFVLWIDNGASTPDGAMVIRYDGSGDSTSNIFYASTVTVTSDDTNPVDILDMDTYDNGTDSDIPYTATDAATDTLVVNSGIEFLVKIKSGVANGSTVFDPNGTVTTNSTGGDFHVDDNGKALLDTATNSIGRDILVDAGATIDIQADTSVSGGDITTTSTGIVTTSTGTPTVTISTSGTIGGGSGVITFYNLTTSGSGTTTLGAADSSTITVNNDVSVGSGTTLDLGSKTLDVNGGNVTTTSTGSITCSSCTAGGLTLAGDGSTNGIGGGSGSITLYSLTLDGTTNTTTAGTHITLMNGLTVGSGRTLAMNTKDLAVGSTGVSGSGDVAITGVVSQSASATTTILSSASGTASFSGAGTFGTYNLTIGNSSTTFTVDNETSDLLVDVNNTFTITTNATYQASSTSTFTVGNNYSNNGTFTANSSTVTMDAGDSGNTLAGTMTGTSSFASLTFNNSGGSWSFSNDATLTGNFTITAATQVTAPSGTLTVGGNFTGGSTFTHNSGTVSLNGSAESTQSLSGATTFNTLLATASSHRTLQFTASTTYTVAGNLTLTGTSCSALLFVRSGTSGTQFTLTDNVGGTTSVSYIDIQDSNATNAVTASTSINSGNNTNWTIAAGGCQGGSTNTIATGYSFQRKTIYDVTNARYWSFFYDGNQIDIRYSSDNGTTWNTVTSLAYNTNDFSVWQKTISSTEYVWLAVASGDDILIRQGTLGTTSITWDTDVTTAFNGSSTTDTYSYPYIALDSANYPWAIARYYNGTNYVMKAVDATVTGNTDPSSWTWNTATQISDSQTNTNVYGNIVPLTSQNMYATFAVGTALEGCKWVDASSAWQDSSGATCASSLGTSNATRSTGGAVKIDDAGDLGTLPEASRQIVQTSGNSVYAVIHDSSTVEVWKSSDGTAWTEQNSGSKPASSTTDAVAIAIDTNDIIHILYGDDSAANTIQYITFNTSTNTFGTEETVTTVGDATFDIVIDTNNKPHVTFKYVSGSNVGTSYTNRISGSWKTRVAMSTEGVGNDYFGMSSVMNEDNIIESSYVNQASDLAVIVGNTNDATSFTETNPDTTLNFTAGQRGTSISIDPSGNTWVTYIDATTNYVTLIKHNDADAWSTWQASITNSNVGSEPSLAFFGSTAMVFYSEDSTDQKVAYDAYDTLVTAWHGEKIVATPGSGIDFTDVKVRYSFIHFQDSEYLDLIYSNGTDVYWNVVDIRSGYKIDDTGDPGALDSVGQSVVRTKAGVLYSFIYDGGSCEVWRSSDGVVWAEQDSANNPTCYDNTIAMAIDTADTIHLLYTTSQTNINYRTFSTGTNTFGTAESAYTAESTVYKTTITIDSNNKPHVTVTDGDNTDFVTICITYIKYLNKVGANWSEILVDSADASGSMSTCENIDGPSISIDEDNIPEIAYINTLDNDLFAEVGNQNNATSFTEHALDTSVTNAGSSIAIDSSGNTLVGYVDATANNVSLAKRTDGSETSSWTTGWTTTTNSNPGYEPSIAATGTNVYIFYEEYSGGFTTGDIYYDVYDGDWTGEVLIQQDNTTPKTFKDAKTKWALIANSFGSNRIDYFFSDNTDIYYSHLLLRSLPIKVDDGSDFGSMTSNSRQLIRNSSGKLYSVVNDEGSCEVWSSPDGKSWVEENSSNNPSCSVDSIPAVALDNSGSLHIIYTHNLNPDILRYITFSTTSNTFGTAESVYDSASSNALVGFADISIDSSNKPHVIFMEDDSFSSLGTLYYVNKTSGSWSSTVSVASGNEGDFRDFSVTINEDNIPEIARIVFGTANVYAHVGNQNNATSFTQATAASSVSSASTSAASIGVDSSGNTWITFVNTTGNIAIVKHNDADAWSTWQSSTHNSNAGFDPQIILDASTVYVLYKNGENDIAYDSYNGSWSGEVVLEEGTYQDVKPRWSYLNNASYSSYGIDYLFSDSTDVWYNSFIISGSVNASQDAVDTIPTGVTKNMSTVADSSGNVHLIFIDDESTDQVSYKKWNGTSWSSATLVADAADADDAYVSLSFASTGNDLYALWIDTADSDIFYSTCDTSTNCDSASEWAVETAWKTTGTNKYVTSNYSNTNRIFALWQDGSSSPVSINWDYILIPAGGNTAPDSPTSLAQKKTTDVTLSTGAWTSETSVKFTVSATDTDGSDTLYLCIEKDNLATSFSNTEDSCGSGVAYSGSPVTLTHTISSITDATEYHWQARVKDTAGDYSSWVQYGGNAESARDFGVDSTAPTGGTVYDGTTTDVDVSYNDGSLSSLSANWSGITSTTSGLSLYEYSIGTTAGSTNVKTWTSNTTSTSVTATGLTLQTSQTYFFNVRTTDNAGNVSTPISSNGIIVSPILAFSLDTNSKTFANLNTGNSFTDTKITTLTTSTNAYNGYVVRAYKTDFLRSSMYPSTYIGDFDGGSYASPAAWGGSNYGFGYTSSDISVQGASKFPSSGACAGGGTAPCYAPFNSTGPGDIVADHTSNVAGSSISNETFDITYKVKTPTTQSAGPYNTAIVYTISPQY